VSTYTVSHYAFSLHILCKERINRTVLVGYMCVSVSDWSISVKVDRHDIPSEIIVPILGPCFRFEHRNRANFEKRKELYSCSSERFRRWCLTFWVSGVWPSTGIL
jgi:hypothetical protein